MLKPIVMYGLGLFAWNAWAAPPSSPEISEGLSLIRAGRVLDAIEVTEREARERPDDLDAQERFIDLMVSLGLPERAQELYQERFRLHPENPDNAYLLGRLSPDVATSRAHDEQALKLNPNHARAWMGIAALQRVEGNWRASATSYDRALRLDPSLGEAWAGLIALFSGIGDDASVLQIAQKAMTARPDLPESYLALAARKPSEAFDLLTKAVSVAPWDARVQSALAVQLLRMDRAQEARKSAQAAIDLDPVSSQARLALALADERLSRVLGLRESIDLLDLPQTADVQKVASTLDRVVQTAPRSAVARLARANFRATAERDGVLEDLETAYRLNPNAPDTGATLGLWLVSRDPARAATLLAPVVASRPQDQTLALGYIRALVAAGKLAEASAAAHEASRIHPFAIELHLLYAHVLEQNGDLDGAWKVAKSLASRMPDLKAQVAWAVAASAAGHDAESASVWERLASQVADPRFAEEARRARERAAGVRP